jgi:DNA-binding HxlR family transcriptional regulator
MDATTPSGPDITQTGACEIRDLLDRLAGKWSLLVVELLGSGSRRFTELRTAIDGISQRMLTLTLRQLERDGLVPHSPDCTARKPCSLRKTGHNLWMRPRPGDMERVVDSVVSPVVAEGLL